MKKVIKASSKTDKRMSTVTPSGKVPKKFFNANDIVEFLHAIVELNGLEIFYEELEDGSIAFTVGDNIYSDIGSK